MQRKNNTINSSTQFTDLKNFSTLDLTAKKENVGHLLVKSSNQIYIY